MIRVVIADDQRLVRDGLDAMLSVEADIGVVGLASDGIEALDLVGRTGPDVAVLDVRMPRLDGIATTRKLMELSQPPAVLVLTTFDLDEHVVDAVKAGASGFLLKDAPRSRLVEAIRTVAAGEMVLDPVPTRRLLEQALARRPAPEAGARVVGLSEREREVLVLVARGLSNAETAAALFVSEATVKTHFGSLLRKTGVRDRAQLVVLAYEAGLVAPGG
ncbi:MAG: response regulator [Actinomycetes bacterium]